LDGSEVIWHEGDGTMDVFASHDLVLDAPGILELILVDFDGDTDLDILWGSFAGGGEVCFLENLGGAVLPIGSLLTRAPQIQILLLLQISTEMEIKILFMVLGRMMMEVKFI
jgi:hypothetical protein